jgi:hypothetical protein
MSSPERTGPQMAQTLLLVVVAAAVVVVTVP